MDKSLKAAQDFLFAIFFPSEKQKMSHSIFNYKNNYIYKLHTIIKWFRKYVRKWRIEIIEQAFKSPNFWRIQHTLFYLSHLG